MTPDPALVAAARELGEILRARGLTVATAESCTGGAIAAAITEIAGSSEWFDRGFVTYSNAAKRELLGVTESTLEAFGAVSEPTALEMVRGAIERSHADLAVSVTGIAGPGGATPGKPVGLVCLAWARRGEAPAAVTRHFAGDRAAIRHASVLAALHGLRERADADKGPGGG